MGLQVGTGHRQGEALQSVHSPVENIQFKELGTMPVRDQGGKGSGRVLVREEAAPRRMNRLKEETQLRQEETEEVGPPSTEDPGGRWGSGLGRWCDEENQWREKDGLMGSETEGSEESREQGRQKGRLWPVGVHMSAHTHTNGVLEVLLLPEF